MKAQYISADGVLLSLCGQPPTVSNTCLTTPHISDLVSVLKERKNNFNWITEHWGDLCAVDREDLSCVTFKDMQMDYDLSVDKNYANTGQKWSRDV